MLFITHIMSQNRCHSQTKCQTNTESKSMQIQNISRVTVTFQQIVLFLRSYQPGRSKLYPKNPSRPLLVTTLSNTKVDDRLPKVEELLEKVDQDMMELQATKQPLKSILNNPVPNSPLHGILKKPKNKQDSKANLEGRRRQRAASESDNLYCNFHIGSPIPGYDK